MSTSHHTRREFLQTLAMGALSGTVAGCASLRSQARRRTDRPNILFIMSDDHACNAIGAYGSGVARTPNIDRIAREGAILRECFCANSICSPSRATILTGVHSHRNEVTHNGATWDGTQRVYSRILGKTGYRTALIGKWHQRPETPRDEVQHWEVLTGHGGQGTYHDPVFATRDVESTAAGYSTDVITDKAIDWLEQNGDGNNPFLLMVQFKSPHVPRRPPSRHFGAPGAQNIPIPKTFFDDYAGRAPYAAKAWMKVWNGRPPTRKSFPAPATPDVRATWETMGEEERLWNRYEDRRNADFHRKLESGAFRDPREFALYLLRRRMQDYLGCVAAVDDNVGRLLERLDAKGLADSTVVVYCSDQSYFIGEHGWMEKRWMYEESMRMPFVVRWPGRIQPGTRVEALTQNIDFAPTFLALAGAEIPVTMQGKSFVPQLLGRPAPGWRDAIYYHYYQHGAHNVPRHDGVRTSRHKLIHYYTDDVYELFELGRDPNELRSVFGDPAYAAVQENLLKRLADLRRHYGVPDRVFRHPYVVLSRSERRKMQANGK